jgi:hypothetical protein
VINLAGCEKLTSMSVMAIAHHCPNLRVLNMSDCNNVRLSSISLSSSALSSNWWDCVRAIGEQRGVDPCATQLYVAGEAQPVTVQAAQVRGARGCRTELPRAAAARTVLVPSCLRSGHRTARHVESAPHTTRCDTIRPTRSR